MHECKFIRQFREIGDEVTDPLATLTPLAKRVLRLCKIPSWTLERDGRPIWHRFPIELNEFRFVVPCLQLADGTGTENDKHLLRFRWKVRAARSKWLTWIDLGWSVCPALGGKQVEHRDGTQRGRGIRQEVASRLVHWEDRESALGVAFTGGGCDVARRTRKCFRMHAGCYY